MKKLILLSILVSSVFILKAQNGPNLVGSHLRSIIKYTGGDTSVRSYFNSSICYNLLFSTLTEGPDGILYGLSGGNGTISNYGIIYAYDYLRDTGFIVFNFNNDTSTGYQPEGSLLLANDGRFYGLTTQGGADSGGTLFSYTINGSFVKLLDMPRASGGGGSLIQASDGNIYGMTRNNVNNAGGTIFRYDITTHALNILYTFPYQAYSYSNLIEAGTDTLYGLSAGQTPSSGGSGGYLFRYIISSGSYTALKDSLYIQEGNSMIKASNGLLYGLTGGGGAYSHGTIFSYNLTSGVYDTLHNFGAPNDGISPWGGLFEASDGKLYGSTNDGGNSLNGTIFQYDLATSTYTEEVQLNNITGTPEYGHFIEYRVLPVSRHPVNVSICAGGIATFLSTDTAIASLVQWQVSRDSGRTYTDVSGANDTIYTYTPLTSESGSLFRAVFSHSGLRDTSISALLTVWHPDTTTLDITLCNGQSVFVLNQIYSASGVYHDTLHYSGSHGCDTIVNLNLTIYPVATDTIHARICQGSSYIFGPDTITSAGTYTDTLIGMSVHGCDSTITLIIDTYPAAIGYINTTICSNSFYIFGHDTLNTTGLYNDTLSGGSILGCDSITVLNLGVFPNNLTAYFTLQPSPTLHVWYIIDSSSRLPGVNYVWSWGDGSPNSTGDTPSHTYDTAGYYFVCVTVSDTTGCSITFCDSSFYVSKATSNNMITVHVVNQIPTGIEQLSDQDLQVFYADDKIQFSKSIYQPSELLLYDLSGRLIKRKEQFTGTRWEMGNSLAQGTYVLSVKNGESQLCKKLFIAQ